MTCDEPHHWHKTGSLLSAACTVHCCTAPLRITIGISVAGAPVTGHTKLTVINIWMLELSHIMLLTLHNVTVLRSTEVCLEIEIVLYYRTLQNNWILCPMFDMWGEWEEILIIFWYHISTLSLWGMCLSNYHRNHHWDTFIVLHSVDSRGAKTESISLLVSFKLAIHNRVNVGKKWMWNII